MVCNKTRATTKNHNTFTTKLNLPIISHMAPTWYARQFAYVVSFGCDRSTTEWYVDTGKENNEEKNKRVWKIYPARREAAHQETFIWERSINYIMGGMKEFCRKKSSGIFFVCLREGLKNYNADITSCVIHSVITAIDQIQRHASPYITKVPIHQVKQARWGVQLRRNIKNSIFGD